MSEGRQHEIAQRTDWEGDPNVPNGTRSWQTPYCKICGAEGEELDERPCKGTDMKLLERDPPGLDHPGWQAMHDRLNQNMTSRIYHQHNLDDATKAIAVAKAALAKLDRADELLIEAMNALRLQVEKERA